MYLVLKGVNYLIYTFIHSTYLFILKAYRRAVQFPSYRILSYVGRHGNIFHALGMHYYMSWLRDTNKEIVKILIRLNIDKCLFYSYQPYDHVNLLVALGLSPR